MQDLDEDPAKAVAAGLDECRRLIDRSIRDHYLEYRRAIGLSDENQQFRQDLIEAILWCTVTHLNPALLKRPSDTRKEMERVGAEAAAAEKHLDGLRSALDRLAPSDRELLEKLLKPLARIALSIVAKQTPWFHALSSVAISADFLAERLKRADKGGAPKMWAFRALVLGLARAFLHAKKRKAKATWNPHDERWEGQFVNLVEAVLPVAKRCAGTADTPMKYPASPKRRGKFIYDATRRGAANKKRSRIA